jgi:hypothetical protein
LALYVDACPQSISAGQTATDRANSAALKGIMTNTVRIARLKLLFIAAKVVRDSNINTTCCSFPFFIKNERVRLQMIGNIHNAYIPGS